MAPDLRGACLALDVDGVLLDAERGGAGHWSAVLADRHGVDPDALQQAFIARAWPEVVVGARPIEPALEAALRELAWDLSVEEVLECWFEADLHVNEEVVAAAARWAGRGAAVVLATEQEHRRAAFLQERLGARLPIRAVLYSADLGAVKRDARFFAAASERLGVGDRPERVVLVDDRAPNVEAARRHGWSAVHYTGDPGWVREVEEALTS